jgi:hypothetical protein
MKRNGIFTAVGLAVAISFSAAPALAQEGPTHGGTGQGPHATPGAIGFVDVAAQHGFGEWARGILGTEWEGRLRDHPHTVFIAGDAAYQLVDPTTRHTWQTDPAAHRQAVGHSIVEGRLTLEDLMQRQHVTTVTGERLPVEVVGPQQVRVGGALIMGPDIEAGPGMIHQVERVILPQQPMQQPAMPQQPMPQQPQQQPVQQPQPMEPQPQPLPQAQPAQPQPMQPQPQPVREPVRKW